MKYGAATAGRFAFRAMAHCAIASFRCLGAPPVYVAVGKHTGFRRAETGMISYGINQFRYKKRLC